MAMDRLVTMSLVISFLNMKQQILQLLLQVGIKNFDLFIKTVNNGRQPGHGR